MLYLGFQFLDTLTGLHLTGDIFLDADEVGQLVRLVEYRSDRQLVPESRAMRAVGAEDLAAGPWVAYGLTDEGQGGLGAVVVLQEAAVAVENIFRCIAGQALKGRIGIEQNIVIAFFFSND